MPRVLLPECSGKKVIGKPCEGEPHARFDEGAVGVSPLLYSTRRIRDSTASLKTWTVFYGWNVGITRRKLASEGAVESLIQRNGVRILGNTRRFIHPPFENGCIRRELAPEDAGDLKSHRSKAGILLFPADKPSRTGPKDTKKKLKRPRKEKWEKAKLFVSKI